MSDPSLLVPLICIWHLDSCNVILWGPASGPLDTKSLSSLSSLSSPLTPHAQPSDRGGLSNVEGGRDGICTFELHCHVTPPQGTSMHIDAHQCGTWGHLGLKHLQIIGTQMDLDGREYTRISLFLTNYSHLRWYRFQVEIISSAFCEESDVLSLGRARNTQPLCKWSGSLGEMRAR